MLVAASVAGGIAAVVALLTAVLWWTLDRRTRRLVVAPLLALGFAGSAVELVLLLVDGAAATDAWPAVALVRLLLLVGLALLPDPLHGPGDRRTAQRAHGVAGPAAVAVALTAGLAATSVLGAPRATGALQTGPVAFALLSGATLLAAALAAVLVRAAARRGDGSAIAAALALVAGLAVPTALALVPDQVPPHQQTQLSVGALTLDLTVAPARAGTNEFHLYAFGTDRQPAPVHDVIVEVEGHPDTRHELLPVSVDHHLSYVLELPARPPVTLRVTLVDEDDQARSVTWGLEAPAS